LLSLGSEGRLKVWDGRDLRRVDAWSVVPDDVGALAAEFSGDGSVLALAGLDGTLSLWDVPRRAALRRFHAPDVDDFGFAALSLSADGRSIAAAPAMGSVGVWDVASGALRFALPTDATVWR